MMEMERVETATDMAQSEEILKQVDELEVDRR